jgi:NarL family two-component system response regulator LiaR
MNEELLMGKTDPIRVLIVDDHAVVRCGLAFFLRAFDDLEPAGEAEDGQAALRACAMLQPDVVLMDMLMPEMDGVTAIRAIKQLYPHIQVIVLTSFPEQALVQQALQAGAVGFLLKNVAADQLAVAIRAAHVGRPTLAPEATQVLIHTAFAAPPTGSDLTAREREVLALMIEGMNNLAIAERLSVSRSTVKYHVSSILSKLGACGRTEAVAVAVQRKLVG